MATKATIAMWGAWLVAPVLAQGNAHAALQRALLIEQKEGDLRAAEQEYRTLLANTDTAVANEAALHLGELLWRLERKDDARPLLERAQGAGGDVGARATAVLQGQDPGGQQAQAAAAKVRDVVDRVVRGGNNDQVAIEEMKWLGAAVVPEFGRRLAALHDPAIEVMQRFWEYRDKQPFPVRDAADAIRHVVFSSISGNPNPEPPQALPIVRQLFQLGGKEAAAILLAQLRDPEPWWRRTIAAATSGPLTVHGTMLPVLEAMVGDADPEGAVPVLAMDAAATQLPIETFARQLASERGNVREAAWTSLPRNPVFRSMWQTTEDSARALTIVLPLVERELASGDPSRSRVAFSFLRIVAQDERGAELMLQWLPKVPVFEQGGQPQNLRAPLASMLACARVLGPANGSDGKDARRWCIGSNAPAVAKKGEAALLLDLVELGYDRVANKPLAAYALNLAPSPADVLRAAALLDRCLDSASVLNEMGKVDLPADAAPPLLRHLDALLANWPVDKGDGRPLQGEQQAAANEAKHVFDVVGRTGSLAALPRLRELRGQRPDLTVWTARTTLAIATHSTDAAYGAALRELLVDKALSPEQRNQVFAHLVSRGDEAAIPLFAQAYELGLAAAPPAQPGTLRVNPSDGVHGVGWLAANCPYSVAQRLAIWQPLLRSDQWFQAMADYSWDDAMSVQAALLETLVARVAQVAEPKQAEGNDRTPPQWLSNRLEGFARILPAGDEADARRCRTAFAKLCANPWVGWLAMQGLQDRNVVRALADQLVPQLRTPRAFAAYQALSRGEVAVPAADVVAGLQAAGDWQYAFLELLPRDAAPEVVRAVEAMVDAPGARERVAACQTLGRFLSAGSATALLTALRDGNPSVREEATKALQQIRLYHEQKAFWDQFQTGISTGREAAAAKLLAQAKPDQPKDQRLLALGSLAALGAPEALPYLIDWSKDPDADVAKAARAAIDRIQAAAEHK